MPTKLLSDDIVSQVKDVFQQLKEPVQLLFFEQEAGCDYCEDTRQLIEEIAELSDKLDLEVYDLDRDAEVAKQYKVDKTPGLVIAGRDGDQILDYGVRYAGIPSGHEFSSLVHDLILVSGRESGLEEGTRKALKDLQKPVHLMVFVTPT
jgi:glutaredoxin-like protein